MGRINQFTLAALVLGCLAGPATAQSMVSAAPAPITSAPVVLTSDSCCDNSCSDRGGHAIANFTFEVLAPYWANNPAVLANEEGGGPALVRDFTFNMQFVPKISLGYLGGGGSG